MTRRMRIAVLVAALLTVSEAAMAQMNTGEIAGSVHDPTGAALPGAPITATQNATRYQFTAVSNSAGEYLFPQLPVGIYSLAVSAENFKESVLQSVEVHAAD